MSLDMHMWFIILIAILKGDKHMHNPLRKIEHKMIKSVNPTLNIAGNPYKSKSKLRGIMAILTIIYLIKDMIHLEIIKFSL